MKRLDPEVQEQLDRLLEALFWEGLNSSRLDELEAILTANQEAQRYYLQQSDLHCQLEEQVDQSDTYLALRSLKAYGFEPDQLSDEGTFSSPQQQMTLRPSPRWLPLVLILLILVIPLTISLFRPADHQPRGPERIAEQISVPLENLPKENVANRFSLPYQMVGNEAHWEPKGLERYSQGRLSYGKHHLLSGQIRLILTEGSELSVAGPALFEITPDNQFRLLEGTFLADLASDFSKYRLSTPWLRIENLGSEFGIRCRQAGEQQLSVFRGEVIVSVDAQVTGIPRSITLNRDEGLQIDPNGALTQAIIGDHGLYATLRKPRETSWPKVSNGSFEYPATSSFTTLAASGWTFLAHPIANANPMEMSAGVLKNLQPDELSSPVNLLPPAPSGTQWGYLTAKINQDGRRSYTSMHQKVGSVIPGISYRVKATVGRRQSPQATPHYRIGLWVGNEVNGPLHPLRIWRELATPLPGQSLELDLAYHCEQGNVFAGEPLFLVIETRPAANVGTQEILIDNVHVDRHQKKQLREQS